MTLRTLPRLEMASKTPNMRSDISEGVIARWNPGLSPSAAAQDATISILDPIGADFFGEGVTARRISGALRNIGDRPVTVTINSPGGDVFEGIAIYNLLRDHPSEVTVRVIGLAASAASVIAMAGDRIEIGRAAFMMIHNSWVCACGDRNGLREIADWLEPFDAAMADLYHAQTGIDLAQIAALMDAETWISGRDAVEQGFATDYLPADAVTVAGDESTASALRAERRFDVLAKRAGLPRSAARALLQDLKGGTQDAAQPHTPEAVDIAAELNSLRLMLTS